MIKHALTPPRWPFVLDENWPLADHCWGLYPGAPEAGNIGTRPDWGAPYPESGATSEMRYRPPTKEGPFVGGSTLNLPRSNTQKDFWNLPGAGEVSGPGSTDDFTVSCWVRLVDDGQVRSVILGNDPNFNVGRITYLEEAASPYFRFSRGLWSGTVQGDAADFRGYGQWHHVTGGNKGGNGGTDFLCVDGHWKSAVALTASVSFSRWRIGSATAVNAQRSMKGQVAHVMIFGRALTEGEATSLYAPETRWSMYRQRRSVSRPIIAAAPTGGLPPGMINARSAVGGIQIDGGMLR